MSKGNLYLSDPNAKNPKGNSAIPADFEEKTAQGRAAANYNKRLKELERNIADLKKLEADKEKLEEQKKKAPAKNAVQGKTRHVAHAKGWKAVCTEPDLCQVGNAIIAFDSFATLDTKQQASPNVKARGTPVYRQGDIVKNVQANAGKHVVSGTSRQTGHVQIKDGHDNVKVNGIPVARHDSACTINCDASGKGGAKGKLVTEQKSVGGGTGSSASNPTAPPGERTSDKLKLLKAARAKIEAEQDDFDVLDQYVDFKRTNEIFAGQIAEIKGLPGTAGDYGKQALRGLLGYGKDLLMGISELAYEGSKGVHKLARRNLTPNGIRLTILDAEILAENFQLGNYTKEGAGTGLLNLGRAIVKPVTDPWSKGQHVEAGTRAVAELGTIWFGWTKAKKAAEAAKAAKAAAAEVAAAAEAAATAQAAKDAAAAAKTSNIPDASATTGHVDDGVHVGGKDWEPPGPTPASWGLTISETKTVLSSAQLPQKQSTIVGHALSKHSGRPATFSKPNVSGAEVWGKITGNMSTWNAQGMAHLKQIILAPGQFKVVTDGSLKFLEKRLPDGRGIRLNLNKTFKGFVD